MKKAMTITYRVDSALYVNVTNRCTNSCDFCIRNNGDGAYNSDSLWLSQEPTVEQITDIIEASRVVKRAYPTLPVRINTNGQSDLIFSKDTAPLYKGAFDTVSISLNSSNGEKYNRLCHPVFGEGTFDAILKFARNVKNCVQNVVFSVVDEFLDAVTADYADYYFIFL